MNHPPPSERAPGRERLLVALGSAIACYLFFAEYLPPLARVHLFGDIEGYHYPLLAYAFQALTHWRIPEWDPSIYCGLSFAGNAQVALFYPPNWLLYLANVRHGGVSYKSIEIFVAMHFALSFWLAYCWLRGKMIRAAPALLGASTFAFGGYVLGEIQHVGVTSAYPWLPLALWGIDRESLPMVAGASALCFLAGYPPMWPVLGLISLAYVMATRPAWIRGTVAALVLSGGLMAVQLLPTIEMAGLKEPEQIYGGESVSSWRFYLNHFTPNFFDQARDKPLTDPSEQYVYLGAPAILAILLAIRRPVRAMAPCLAMIAICIVMIEDPGGIPARLTNIVHAVNELLHGWNFLAGFPLTAALLTATALDAFLERSGRVLAPWMTPVVAVGAMAWCARQWYVWVPGGPEFAASWGTFAEVAISVAMVGALLWVYRAQRNRAVLAMLLFLVFTDAKVYGTNRRFDAKVGDTDREFHQDRRTGGLDFKGIDSAVYGYMRRYQEYRVLLDGPYATDMRFYRLSTPYGFDPFLPAQYKREVRRFGEFSTNRLFTMDNTKEEVLRHFGARFVVTTADRKAYEVLSANPRFRLLEPSGSFYKVFEYLDAEPGFRFEGRVEYTRWEPEWREFRTKSDRPGALVLLEQRFPGWRAEVDGQEVAVNPYSEAFQQVEVPEGEHTVRWVYRSRALRYGAAISIVSLAIVCGLSFLGARRRSLQ